MSTRSLMSMFATAALGLTLAGCSEKPQEMSYEQRSYQGKADAQPWDSPVFKGDKAAWEIAMKNRALGQNEYNRIK